MSWTITFKQLSQFGRYFIYQACALDNSEHAEHIMVQMIFSKKFPIYETIE